MRNRAKCNLCKDVIESFTVQDYVSCSCGEIAVDGGNQFLRCHAKNWENFLRIDENEKEIPINLMEKEKEEEHPCDEPPPQLTKETLLNSVNELINSIENLPQHAMLTPINQYDYYSLLLLMSSFLRL